MVDHGESLLKRRGGSPALVVDFVRTGKLRELGKGRPRRSSCFARGSARTGNLPINVIFGTPIPRLQSGRHSQQGPPKLPSVYVGHVGQVSEPARSCARFGRLGNLPDVETQ